MTSSAVAVPPWSLGWRLRRSLEPAMTREDMAEHCGVKPQTITRWTHDDGRPPLPPVLKLWAELCGVPLDWLTHGVGSIEEPVRTTPREAKIAELNDEAMQAAAALEQDCQNGSLA